MSFQIKSVLGSVALAAVVLSGVAHADVGITGVGRFAFTDASGSGAQGLSGITYVGSNQFKAASDKSAALYPLTVGINSGTGAITSASLAAGLALTDTDGSPLSSVDREGVAYDASSNSVLLSSEVGPQIRRHSLSDGKTLSLTDTSSHAQLGVFSNIRSNYGWESLTRQADGSAIWTSNEEALTVDGPTATPSAGSTVRLQKFNGSMTPQGQWAYTTDPVTDTIQNPSQAIGQERSGVSDLLALPDGTLLVLERELGGVDFILQNVAQYRIRIYQVDFSSATDISGEASLSSPSGPFTPVSKTLLWTYVSFLPEDNFEGMTLGPQLDNGDYSLLLVGDSGTSSTHALYSLRLTGIPEPTGLLPLTAAATLLRRRRR